MSKKPTCRVDWRGGGEFATKAHIITCLPPRSVGNVSLPSNKQTGCSKLCAPEEKIKGKSAIPAESYNTWKISFAIRLESPLKV